MNGCLRNVCLTITVNTLYLVFRFLCCFVKFGTFLAGPSMEHNLSFWLASPIRHVFQDGCLLMLYVSNRCRSGLYDALDFHTNLNSGP